MRACSRRAYVSIYTASIVRILVVATKTPWPPADGGRLVLWLALQGLAQAGHEIALVAPVDASRVAQSVDDQIQLRTVCQPNLVEVRHRSFLTLAVDCIRRRRPFSLSRHASDAVRDAAAEQIRKFRPDVIHAEQLQSLANCDADGELAIPLLLLGPGQSALEFAGLMWAGFSAATVVLGSTVNSSRLIHRLTSMAPVASIGSRAGLEIKIRTVDSSVTQTPPD